MIFGDAVTSAPSAEPAGWLGAERSDDGGTVGWLVPARYDSIVRVAANEPCDDWWTGYRELHRTVLAVGLRHTSSPDRAWFAVWEGHGFTNWSAHIAWRDPAPDEATRLARESERDRVRADARREIAGIGSALARVTTFDAPHRRYYLLTGPVDAALELRDPARIGAPDGWRHPDLWWPDDRGWFVATDVDFWSLYVAGDAAFVGDIRAAVPTATEEVERRSPLVVED